MNGSVLSPMAIFYSISRHAAVYPVADSGMVYGRGVPRVASVGALYSGMPGPSMIGPGPS